MKVKVKKIVPRTVTKEFELGNKGDDILVRSVSDHYRFGKLEGVFQKPGQYDTKPSHKYGVGDDNPFLKFSGESYALALVRESFPTFRIIQPSEGSEGLSWGSNSPNFISLKYTHSVYVGLDNIFSHLENKAPSRYKGHADLIRKLVSQRRKWQ